MISRIGRKFAFNIQSLVPLACELAVESVFGCLNPLCMPCKYYLQIGWLFENSLLAACPLLGSFGTKLNRYVQRHLLHGGAECIFILALVNRANGEYVSFEVLSGPNF